MCVLYVVCVLYVCVVLLYGGGVLFDLDWRSFYLLSVIYLYVVCFYFIISVLLSLVGCIII